MTDEQSSAEALDGEVLGDDLAPGEQPDLHQHGDLGPMSFEDPTVSVGGTEAVDDLETRTWRETPDPKATDSVSSDREVVRLVQHDQSIEGGQMLGEDMGADEGDVDPEDAAIHLEGNG